MRAFGATGIDVSPLAFGGGRVGEDSVSEAEAERLLGGALDAGITVVDTARSYGASEERIGRYLAHRRQSFVLSTKGGYGVDGVPDWTAEAVRRGVDEALARLRTDVIDVFHLHSCPRDVLERGDVVRALDDARRAGKVRVAAYSGENDALDFALASDAFGSVQCSVSLADQRVLDGAAPLAVSRGIGVLAKRAIANAAWRFAERPRGDYAETYWCRLRAMGLDPRELPELLWNGREAPDLGAAWTEVAVRFTAFAPGVSSAIVGTRSLDHLRACAAAVAKGPLPAATIDAIRSAFRTRDDGGEGWRGEV